MQSHFLEIEKTYLARSSPVDIGKTTFQQVIDVYLLDSNASVIRLRQKGDKFELTKKVRLNNNSASSHTEYTIPLTKQEFDLFAKMGGKVVSKKRYKFNYQDLTGELDIFDGDLMGLVLVDFEFDSEEQFKNFKMPNFCLADVTEEDFVAGKNLAGKKYAELEADLIRFGYNKLS